ncbi:hypothetical protein DFH27DRAFT_562615, partial [Peziza echinospora]
MQFKLSTSAILLITACILPHHQGSATPIKESQSDSDIDPLPVSSSMLECNPRYTHCISRDRYREGCCPLGSLCCPGDSNYACCKSWEACVSELGRAYCKIPGPPTEPGPRR